MSATARRSVLWLSLLCALALPSESIPAPAPPITTRHPIYRHASKFQDLDLPAFTPVAPANDCAGRNLHALVAKWQRLLYLNHWQVTIYCGLPETHDKWELAGRVYTYPRRHLAYIYVAPETERPLEEMVVHELLHVTMRDLNVMGTGLLDEREEQVVEVLTHRLYRGYAQ